LSTAFLEEFLFEAKSSDHRLEDLAKIWLLNQNMKYKTLIIFLSLWPPHSKPNIRNLGIFYYFSPSLLGLAPSKMTSFINY
jgi:hypothetical protein